MAQNFNIVAKLALQGPNNVKAVVKQITNQLNSVQANVQINVANNINQRLNTLNTNLQRINASLLSIRHAGLQANQALQQLSQTLNSIKNQGNNITITTKGLNNVGKAANNAATAMGTFGSQAGLAVRRFLAFAAPTSIFLGLVAAVKEGVSEAISFEKEMTRVAQVTGRSVASLSDLSTEITRLATGLGVSSKELGNVATTIAQAGLSAKDTKTALEALARSSLAATFTDIQSTTEGAIAVFRQFNVSADQLQGVIGSLNAVSAQFAVESDDLISAIRRTGGAFKVSGGNLNELLGLFTSVRATTRESADSIATGFRTIFTRIQRPKTIQFLKELGVELQNAKGQFVGPVESIRKLNAALAEIPTTDPRFAAVIEELGGFRQVSKVIPLIQQFPEALKAISVAEQGQLSIVEDSITAQKALANQLVKTKEEFLALFRELTSDKSFQFFVRTSLDLARSLIDVTRAIKPLIPLLGTLAIIQTGRGAGAFASNFAGALGGRKKFAGGGKVPGSGNSDSVPALLTPGEFVINKGSASAIGMGNLSRINKFASGGPVRQFGVAALEPVGFNQKLNQTVTTTGIDPKTGKPVKIKENVDVFAGGLTKQFADSAKRNIRNNVARSASSIAQGLQTQLGIPASQPADIDKILGRAGLDVTTGNIFEAAVRLAGAPFDALDSKAIDFPGGLGKLAPAFGIPGNIPTDTKKTFTLNKFLSRNVANFLKEELTRGALPASSVKSVGTKASVAALAGIAGIKSGKKFFTGELARKLGRPGAKLPDLLADPTVAANFNFDPKKGFIKKASGGSIGGVGNTDTVPALLTPGEFVINKSAASRIGSANLNAMNKFARGGRVPPSSGSGGNIGLGALALTGLSSLVPTFTDLEKESSQLVKDFTAISAAATSFIFLFRSFANPDKLSRFTKITPGGNVFGGFGRSPGQIAVLSSTRFLAKNFDSLSLGIGAVTGALTVFGAKMQAESLVAARLASNEAGLASAISKGKSGARLIGTSTGAGVGSFLGTAIAPGIGTAVGAAAGGGIGFLLSDLASNEKELIQAFRQAQFDKVGEKLDTLFDDLNAGRIGGGAANSAIGSSLAEQLANIKGTADTGQRGELTKQFRNNLVNIRSLSQAMAGQVTDFNQFKAAFGGAGKTIVESIALLTRKSLPEVQKEIENEINARRSAAEAARKRAESEKTVERLTISLRTFQEALEHVSDKLELTGNKFDVFASSIAGEIGHARLTSIPGNLFERAAAGRVSNASRVGLAASQLVGGINAPSVKAIAENAAGVTKLTNELPNILEKISANVGLGANDEAAQAFFNREIDILKGIPDSLKEAVKDIFGAEVAGRGGSTGEAGVLSSIRSDLPGFAGRLIPEASKAALGQLTDILKLTQEQLDSIGKRLVQQSQLELAISEKKSALEEKILDFTRSRLKEGEHLTFDRVSSSVAAGRAAILAGTGFGGRSEVGPVAGRLREIAAEQKEAQEALNNAKTPEGRASALEEFTKLGGEAARLRKYLQDLGDSTSELTHLQEELNRAEQDRKAGKSLASDLLFGDRQNRVAFSRFTRVAGLVNKGADLANFAPQIRKEFFDILERLPQNSKLGGLGGLTVEEFKNEQIRRSFVNRAGFEGAKVKDAEAFINELTTSSKKEDEIRKNIETVQNKSIEALEALNDIDTELVAELKILNDHTLKDFVRDIRDAVASAAIANLSSRQNSLQSSVNGQRASLKGFRSLSAATFGDIDPQQAVTLFNRIKANEGNFRSLFGANAESKRISGLNVNSKGIATDILKNTHDNTITQENLNKVLNANLADLSPKDREEIIKTFLSDFNNSGFFTGKQQGGRGQITSKTNVLAKVNELVGTAKTNLGTAPAEQAAKASEALNRAFGKDLPAIMNNLLKSSGDFETFITKLDSLDKSLFTGANSIDNYRQHIHNLEVEIEGIRGQIGELRGGAAAGMATGGMVSSRGSSRGLVSFVPRGSDTVPAMLSPGEFVMNAAATQANLPILTAMNAQGFASGGKVKRKQVLEARAAALHAITIDPTKLARQRLRTQRIAQMQQTRRAKKAIADINAHDAAMLPGHGFTPSPGPGLIGPLAAAKFAERSAENKKRINDNAVFTAGLRASRKEFRFGPEGLNNMLIDMRKERFKDSMAANAARIQERDAKKKERLIDALTGGAGMMGVAGGFFASGGRVGGSGSGDIVPAMLTPGEFVLNKRAAAAIGPSALSNFNARFANGGSVGGGGSGDSSALASSMSRFAEVGSALANALSRWSLSANQLHETLASFPHEVTVNHSPITLAVNVAGLEGLEKTVIDKVMTAMNDRLGDQKAKAADGKSPFFQK